MKILILTILFFFIFNSYAVIGKETYLITKGNATYQVSYLTKTVEGTSTNIKGKIICNKGCSYLFASLVKDFISSDSNRDLRMINTVKGVTNPIVTVRGNIPQLSNKKLVTTDFNVSFAGKKHTYKNVKMKLVKNNKFNITLKGSFLLTLSHFDIERPSLLLIKINDVVPIHFKLTLQKD